MLERNVWRFLVRKASFFGLACAAVLAGWSPSAFAALDGINDLGFETTALGSLSDSGGVEQWSSYGDNTLRFTVTSDVAHSGTQSITNTESFTNSPSGFTLLYQFDTTTDPTDILGKTFDYSFWLYYDATLAGQNQASDSIGFTFNARDPINETPPGASADGTIQASTLTSKTWTHFTGSFTVPDDSSLVSQPLDRVSAVLAAPSGKWYADDITIAPEAVPEPSTIVLGGFGAALCLLGLHRKRS